MKNNLWKRAGKILLWTLVGLIVLIVSVPFLLYVPFIQDFACKVAVEQVHKATGMTIDVGYLRLRFPLNLQVDSLTVIEAVGDTMLTAGNAEVSVALKPLFHKEIQISSVSLADASYRMGGPDSVMFLTARICKFEAADTEIPMSFSRVVLDDALLDGADVSLILKDTTVVSPPDTAKANPMVIKVGDVRLRNVRYRMQMLPVIDSLSAFIGDASLKNGKVDMGRHTIDADALTVDSVSAVYLTPSLAWLKEHPAEPADSSVTEPSSDPWTIKAKKVRLTARDALYATRGVTRVPGFDPSYIAVKNVVIDVDSFYNRATSIVVPLRHLAAEERSGLSMMASGTFEMDSLLMQARDFNIATSRSNLFLDASMGMGNLMADSDLPLGLKANGTIALEDVRKFMPSLSDYLSSLPASAGLQVNTDIHGTPASLAVDRLMLHLPGYITLNADGRVDNPFDFNKMGGAIDFDGTLNNLNGVKNSLLPAATARQFAIPNSTIKGSIVYSPGNIDGDVKVTTAGGRLALDGKWNDKAQGYTADFMAVDFPVNAFLPSYGIGNLTADVSLDGRGYNPSSRSTRMKAAVNLQSVEYNGERLGNIKLDAALDTCRLTATVVSDNVMADFDADAAATFKGGGYQWDLSTDIRSIDLKALKLSETPMNGTGTIYTTGAYYPRSGNIDAEMELNDVHWVMDSLTFDVNAMTAKLNSSDSLTYASLVSGDFNTELTAMESIYDVAKKFTAASDILAYQIKERNVNVDSLQKSLPHMALTVTSGDANPVAAYLKESVGMTYRHADIFFVNDSLITLHTNVSGFKTGSTKLDRISFNADQHGKYLVYTASVNNNPGTMDDFAHVVLNGYVADDKIAAMLRQSNIKGRQGFVVGFNASIADSTVTLRLVPYNPTIAYRKWEINKDNEISYNFIDRHLDANLKVMSDSSYLHIYTEHVHAADSLTHRPYQEDVIVKLANINLQEWLSISPFAPPIKGDVDADMRFRWDSNEITGKGTVALNELYYGRDRVGTFNLDVNVANDSHTKALNADVALMVDGHKVITATGALNDSTAVNPFLLDFSMIHFPLRVVNPFLPKDMAQLSGMLNGQMKITGNMANPIFNGYLDFDSSAVMVGMTGGSYKFSEEKIPVDSNIVRFSDFSISGLNNKPLTVNGTVDARHISAISYDLALKARGMQVVNSSRARSGASLYGKAFLDIDATARGNMQFMSVDASLNVLPETNVTYVMTDVQQALTSRSSDDMVRFVSFADTTNVEKADSLIQTSMAMMLDANLIISEGSTINVDLSANGKNKVQIKGAGNLSYNLTPMNNPGRMTGRFTINSGFVRYTPELETGGVSMAIMSEKNFSFSEGSYIAFNGDIMNPTINVTATDRLKANVTQSGQNSRLVNFDVTLSITNTLQNLNVAFNLSTDDDITIANELRTMSPEQRANQAMNMLLYNQYTGPGTKANANLSGNPLYSFLASQLNTWAANNIRGVDISFGIDQYDSTTNGSRSTTTSYSYRVSKTLFNDRFKIVVGGNYSTDANADENFSQNLINDISFEYMLNRSGSMYVRLFRHVGYESILEGEITQTGVGFVMKRKLNSLRDLFRFGSGKEAPSLVPAAAVQNPPVTETPVKAYETDSIR